ncbi:hypothetical protein [Haloplanus salilacus]|uniref:hypothetical protein n=1 Tax=Haloplanus salilacus TaxID=2949994 RepID=UPI0030D3D000
MRPTRLAGQTLLAVATVLFLTAAVGTATGVVVVGASLPVVGAAVCCVVAGGVLLR